MTETGIFSEIKENILNKMTFSYPQVDNIETVVCYRHCPVDLFRLKS